MAIWFSADLHFGHRNIIEFCQRPFDYVYEMNEGLVAGWNAVVEPDDEVWLLGDVAMGIVRRSLRDVARLHGRLHLVAGNHDRVFRKSERARPDWEQEYLDFGFATIHHGSVDIECGGVPVRLCHFPYVGDSGVTYRYDGHRPVDDGGWLLHGHVHDVWRQRGRMINVGVDAWAGAPVSELVVAELIADGPRDLPPLPW